MNSASEFILSCLRFGGKGLSLLLTYAALLCAIATVASAWFVLRSFVATQAQKLGWRQTGVGVTKFGSQPRSLQQCSKCAFIFHIFSALSARINAIGFSR
jgi:hypothetical protein